VPTQPRIRNMTIKDTTVVLFDIDGTLVDMRGAGRKSFVRALKSVFGWDDHIEYINFAGNTDLNVLFQVAEHHGVDISTDDQKQFFRQLPVELEETVKETDLVVFPGVRPLLEALADRDDVILGLVTGNVAASARIKLKQFDLHNHFVLGAFGDDHADRAEIPYDILAAKSIAATSVAVATGKHTAEQLREAGADHVLTNLSDTQQVLRILDSASL